MKVLQIINSLGIGGAEKLLVDVVPLLNEKGFDTDVLVLNGKETSFVTELKDNNKVKIFSLGKSYYNFFYVFKIIPYLYKYDLIHVHLFPCQYFVVFSKLLGFAKVNLLFTEHSTSNRRLRDAKFKYIEKFIYSYYKKVICITDGVQSSLINKLGLNSEKLVVVENGINVTKINAAICTNRNLLGFVESDRLIIMVAAFREQKDQDTVIRSLKTLPIEYKLLLVGDGVRKNDLLSLIQELGLQNRVKLLGERSDVYSLLKMCDVAVLSSHWEGFGLAAAEAMASGTPTIASNVSGLSEVIAGGGILFEKGNVIDLSEKILSLEDPILYDTTGKAGMVRARSFDISIMVNKIIEIYKSL